MTDEFAQKLNDLLVNTFQSILKVEEQVLRSTGETELSMSEVHVIESAGKGYPMPLRQNPVFTPDEVTQQTIKDIADDLDITMPSVTVAVNKLVKKGYLEKLRSPEDGRKVFVGLTDKGQRVYRLHRRFHDLMVNRVSRIFSEDEQAILIRAIEKLDSFFTNIIAEERSREL